MEKTSKDLQKEQLKREKEEALEKQTSDDFSAKKTKAQQSGGDLVKQLAAWLDNPPFKSKNSNLKFETFYAIMNLMGQLKPDNIEKIASLGLDAKQAITLSKYIFKAFDLLDKRDQTAELAQWKVSAERHQAYANMWKYLTFGGVVANTALWLYF